MSNTPTLNETLKLLTKGGPHHPKLVEAIYGVYDLVDSLLQQVDQYHTLVSDANEEFNNLLSDLKATAARRDKYRKALEEIASEEMMIGSTPVKMKHIACKALGRE